MMKTHVHMDTRGGSRLLMALLAFALLAYAMSAGAGMEMVWGDESVGEPIASDASYNEAAGLDDAPSDDEDNREALEPHDNSEPEESNEEERCMLEGLSSLRARLDAARTQLVSERTAFDDARAAFARSTCAQETLMRSDKDAQGRVAGLENARHRALVLLKLVQDELMQSDEYTTHALMTGSSTLRDVTLRHDMLERLMIVEGEQMRRLICDQKRLRAAIVLDAACAHHVRQELRASVQSINELAYKVEEGCARLRQCVKEIELSIEEGDNRRAAVIETKDAMRSAIRDTLSLLADAEQDVGSWYDELDARAGAQGALSFGEGLDFALDEDAFIEIWGTAIDEYFADRARTAGAMPLQGHGREMAASAYLHKVDPRLCAAISVAESGGGQSCIRPYNAWGWGAADSDPYGLAAEWSSFTEAIGAWHEGVVTSTSGLASAKTVSGLGGIYCSSPAWGVTVIEEMRRISEYAR